MFKFKGVITKGIKRQALLLSFQGLLGDASFIKTVMGMDMNLGFFVFALLHSVIGPENLYHSLDQSHAKLKTNHDLVASVFPRSRQLTCLNFY